ncbi:MAG: ferritin family protein [Candidatus Omnitrophota bacterium]|nr:ferritin family protein [Candidatus Omnitrophota bacterium]
MQERFSGCEMVEMGIQIEKNGKEFYSELAEKFKKESVGEVFKCLAAEEEKHIEVFNGIFASLCSYLPEEAYPDEYFAYMNALASQYVFTRKNTGKTIAEKLKNYDEGLNLGISFEKDSILFYEGMRQMVLERDYKLIDKLIQEEKEHLKKLCELRRKDKDEEC